MALSAIIVAGSVFFMNKSYEYRFKDYVDKEYFLKRLKKYME
jgi:hypothetical protein